MKSMKSSLNELLGKEYMASVLAGAGFFEASNDSCQALAAKEVEFMPQEIISKMESLLDRVGDQVVAPFTTENQGAPTDAFRLASNLSASPIGGLGYFRVGENGRLYLTAKSEHYHTSLGHNFPGYKLIDIARSLGISNATHNNTRGYITRLLERELVRTVNGIDRGEEEELERVIQSSESGVLNRVINLDTGTLACEAAIKMMLARFYKLDEVFEKPVYSGRIPVFFVIADNQGGRKANYHGTTIFAQVMRDMWPEMYDKMEQAQVMKIVPVQMNDIEDFKAKLEQFNTPQYKTAGFLHEIIMMNYGGIKLEPAFLKQAYELCQATDTPVMCDEIQSCMWYPGMFLFKAYGLRPDFVIIGKGFPGGEYSASRILTTSRMDNLSQFGALVTNGQEELAALAYLITMRFAEENSAFIHETGEYYEQSLREMVHKYPAFIDRIEGKGHLSTLFFFEADKVVQFTRLMNDQCIDISSQTYKASCPPTALTKPPIIASKTMIDFLLRKIDQALQVLQTNARKEQVEI